MAQSSPAPRSPARTATPEELAKGDVFDLERRLTALEERLDPATDYTLSPDDDDAADDNEPADEAQALDTLWHLFHEEDGTRRVSPIEVMCEPVDDIANGHLRPQTWAQLCDCLGALGEAVNSLVSDLSALEDAGRPQQELVANLSRAVAGASQRPAHDVAEALVLGTVTKLLSRGRHDAAWDLQRMWRCIELYSQDRCDEAAELTKDLEARAPTRPVRCKPEVIAPR